MWLINTQTLDLDHVDEAVDSSYAILSHTWEDEEVTFQEIQNRTSPVETKKGWLKIQACCKQALKDGHKYVWADTCCIDKSSSTELSEAINSMFDWYAKSEICYVYLADLQGLRNRFDAEECHEKIKHCRWFTRGWTLQELLAPSHIRFFDSNWQTIGTKLSLSKTLSQITSINYDALSGTKHLGDFNVAERLSWAAGRRTKRVEDRAYSLLGLFDIHMPLLYGEGNRAFRRLQEHVIENTEDYTIFAWQPSTRDNTEHYSSMLASSPDDFDQRDSKNAWRYHQLSPIPNITSRVATSNSQTLAFSFPMQLGQEPPSVSSRGIKLHLRMAEQSRLAMWGFLTTIDFGAGDSDHWLALRLARSPKSHAHITKSSTAIYRCHRWPRELVVTKADELGPVSMQQIYGATADLLHNNTNSIQLGDETLLRILDTFVQSNPTSVESSMSPKELARQLKARAWCMKCSAYTMSWNGKCSACNHSDIKLKYAFLQSQARNRKLTGAELKTSASMKRMIDSFEILGLGEDLDWKLYEAESVLCSRYSGLAGPAIVLFLCCAFSYAQELARAELYDLALDIWYKRIVCAAPKRCDVVLAFALELQSSYANNRRQPWFNGSDSPQVLMSDVVDCAGVLSDSDNSQANFVLGAVQARCRYMMEERHGILTDSEVRGCSLDGRWELFQTPEQFCKHFQASLDEPPRASHVDEVIAWLGGIMETWSDFGTAEVRRLLFDCVWEVCNYVDEHGRRMSEQDDFVDDEDNVDYEDVPYDDDENAGNRYGGQPMTSVPSITLIDVATFLKYYYTVEDRGSAPRSSVEALREGLGRQPGWKGLVEAVMKDAAQRVDTLKNYQRDLHYHEHPVECDSQCGQQVPAVKNTDL